MKIRHIFAALVAALVIALLAACGTSNIGNGNGEGGIVEGGMKVSLEETGAYQYKLIIQNDKAKDETLTFPSSQDYEYSIKKPDGTIAYTYSSDKMFMAVVEEEVLKPGEKLEIELDITEAFSYLEAGDYTLEAWVTANGVEDKKVSSKFSFDGM